VQPKASKAALIFSASSEDTLSASPKVVALPMNPAAANAIKMNLIFKPPACMPAIADLARRRSPLYLSMPTPGKRLYRLKAAP
jgi:hypothetical protein